MKFQFRGKLVKNLSLQAGKDDDWFILIGAWHRVHWGRRGCDPRYWPVSLPLAIGLALDWHRLDPRNFRRRDPLIIECSPYPMVDIDQARSWYWQADPVHDFDHVLRVYRMAESLARAEGADLEIVRTAALLHDAQGSAPGGDAAERANHHQASADFARRVLLNENWPEDRIDAVLHCIRAHRFRDHSEPPQTLEAQILFDADKLDVIGAIGAVRTIIYAVLDGKPVYSEPSDQFRLTGKEEPGELHSSYHEYVFKIEQD